MDMQHVQAFVSSTVATFKTMINMEIKPGTPVLKQTPSPTFDVSGIIGLSGNAQGSFAISFPKAVAMTAAASMLGSPVAENSPDMTDCIGEIANIIAGFAKKDLAALQLSISLPNVVIGRDHVLSGQRGVPTMIVPFTSPQGEFAIEVALKIS